MKTADIVAPTEMEIYRHISPARLQALIDYIRTDTTGWKAVDVSIEGDQKPDIHDIAERVRAFFGRRPGAIFVCGARKVLTLVRLDDTVEFPLLKKQMTEHLPEYKCSINTGNVTREGLEVIAIRLKVATEAEAAEQTEPETPQTAATPAQAASTAFGSTLLRQRLARYRRVFIVVDDDLFMRSLLTKALSPHGEVIALDDGAGLLDAYRQHVPDVVFLDIHLPSGSGVDLLEEIMQYDHTAGVVILSADRVKDNVLLAQARGARSFVAKPFTRDKIEEAMRKCLEQAALLAR